MRRNAEARRIIGMEFMQAIVDEEKSSREKKKPWF